MMRDMLLMTNLSVVPSALLLIFGLNCRHYELRSPYLPGDCRSFGTSIVSYYFYCRGFVLRTSPPDYILTPILGFLRTKQKASPNSETLFYIHLPKANSLSLFNNSQLINNILSFTDFLDAP